MTGQTCALPGCFKPRCVRPGSTPPLTCGNFHHQLLMASRLNPDAYLAILHRNNVGLCALFSCAEPPHEGHPWCSLTHYLLWPEFTSSLHPELQICMLPGCTRHVYVDEDGSPPSRFCGWRHKQEYVKLSALQHGQQEPLCPSVKVSLTQQQPAPMQRPASSNESEGGHLPSLNSRLQSLKQFALSGTRPKDSIVLEDFYEKHPWEVFEEGGHARWLIARPKFTSKGLRQLITKGSYHWKQSGRQAKEDECTVKYYTYTKMKGKGKQDDHRQHHAESSYTMQEFILEDVKSYPLIHLVTEKPSSDGKRGKERPCNHQSADDQVDYVCVQDTVTMSDPHGDHGCADPHGSCQSGSADSALLMFGEGVAQAQLCLDMFTHGEEACFPLVFPWH